MEVLQGTEDALQVTKALMIECQSEELVASVKAFLLARSFDVTFRSVNWEGLSVVHLAGVGAFTK